MFAERLAKRNRRAKRARAMPEDEPARGPGRHTVSPIEVGRKVLPQTCAWGQGENWRGDDNSAHFLSNKYVLVRTAMPLLDQRGEGTLQLVGTARI